MDMKPDLILLSGEYAIHRLPGNAPIPAGLEDTGFSAICYTGGDMTLVCPADMRPAAQRTTAGWSVFEVKGPLDFSLTGVLAGISSVLAEADISIFALSSWDTDSILVRKQQAEAACEALRAAGYRVDTRP